MISRLCHICQGSYENKGKKIVCSNCGYIYLPANETDFMINVYDVKEKIDKNKDFILLDVREPFELSISKINNAILIPLSKIPKNLDKLDRTKDIIAFCRSGERSHHAARFLIQKGFNAKNMDGGINMWATLVDNNLLTY